MTAASSTACLTYLIGNTSQLSIHVDKTCREDSGAHTCEPGNRRACWIHWNKGGTSQASRRILKPRSLPLGTMRGMFSGKPPPVMCTTPCGCKLYLSACMPCPHNTVQRLSNRLSHPTCVPSPTRKGLTESHYLKSSRCRQKQKVVNRLRRAAPTCYCRQSKEFKSTASVAQSRTRTSTPWAQISASSRRT